MSQTNAAGSVFWALVKNDLKREWHHSRHEQVWWKYYVGFAILFIEVIYTWAVLQGAVRIEFMLLALPGLFFLPIVFGWQVIKREWRSGTFGWWLALPYSRRLLLGAKCLASYLRFLRTVLIFFGVILVLIVEAILLRPVLWNWSSIADVLRLISLMAIWLFAFSPVATLLGITMGVLQKSRWRAALPLVWLLFVVFGNVFSQVTTVQRLAVQQPGNTGPLISFNYQPIGYIYSLFPLVIAVILYFFAVFVLERQVEA